MYPTYVSAVGRKKSTASGSNSSVMGVATGPGLTSWTVIPVPASSVARAYKAHYDIVSDLG